MEYFHDFIYQDHPASPLQCRLAVGNMHWQTNPRNTGWQMKSQNTTKHSKATKFAT